MSFYTLLVTLFVKFFAEFFKWISLLVGRPLTVGERALLTLTQTGHFGTNVNSYLADKIRKHDRFKTKSKILVIMSLFISHSTRHDIHKCSPVNHR